MGGAAKIEGRLIELTFGAVDATPDLHEVGEILARVGSVKLEGSPPSPKIRGKVSAPAIMKGLSVTVELRYEGETIEDALEGRPVGVAAVFEAAGGRVVAGGLGTMTFRAA